MEEVDVVAEQEIEAGDVAQTPHPETLADFAHTATRMVRSEAEVAGMEFGGPVLGGPGVAGSVNVERGFGGNAGAGLESAESEVLAIEGAGFEDAELVVVVAETEVAGLEIGLEQAVVLELP